ncbi:LLM class F420-dependent oxidoreductase [Streptomyces chartreusis]|uniref:LLM class F420-dependent oxidoreductase n=1 Tax=Streptomyces chartreusis TaxID=1969 RepID=UPI00380D6AB2
MREALRWGMTFPLDGIPLSNQRVLVEALPDLGFTDLWSLEADGADAFTPLALAAVWEPRLSLGTSVVSAYTRGPALLAMHAAALAEAAPGRFSLGIGASSSTIVSQWNAMPYGQPVERCRDMVRFLRSALSGRLMDEKYATFGVHGFQLQRPPDHPPPILLAALRPKMAELAAREADGVILTLLSAADVREAVGKYRTPGWDIAARILVCPTEDAEYARSVGRKLIARHMKIPVYAEHQRSLGRAEDFKPVWHAWEAKDAKKAIAAVPDHVVDELIVHGSPRQCSERLFEFARQGVTLPLISILRTPEMFDRRTDPLQALLQFLAEMSSGWRK